MYSAEISKRHHEAQNSRTFGTGQWLLDSKEYKDWFNSSGGLLWLYGVGEFTKTIDKNELTGTNVAGCGKTVLWYDYS